jgi:hypothetical protein
MVNKTTWLNIKQMWRLALSLLREWKVPFKDLEEGKSGQFMDLLMLNLRSHLLLQRS